MKSTNKITTTILTSRPDFNKMSDEEASDYMMSYIEKSCAKDSILLRKVPESLREDLHQEIFLNLWKNRKSYNPTKAIFKTYAYCICYTTVCNFLSKEQDFQQRKMTSALKTNKKKSYNPIATILSQDQMEFVLNSMSDFDKKVAIDKFINHQNTTEIANKYQCSQATIFNIIKKLKKYKDSIIIEY